MQDISGLRGIHKDEVLTVIGRGPSLVRLQSDDLDGVVMAISQAIEKVEELRPTNPLYSLQKDHLYLYPKRAILLLHELEALRDIGHTNYEPSYSFNVTKDFEVSWSLPSVVVAEKLAVWFGCKSVVYLCCDAITDGITEAYGPPATRPQDYLLHAALVKQSATLPVEWRRI